MFASDLVLLAEARTRSWVSTMDGFLKSIAHLASGTLTFSPPLCPNFNLCEVDSGTTFTYLPDAYFQHLRSQFSDLCDRDSSLSCGFSRDMPACFDSTDYFDLATKLPVITFSTSQGSIDLEPLDYLYAQNSQFCVALLADDGAGPVLGMTFLMG